MVGQRRIEDNRAVIFDYQTPFLHSPSEDVIQTMRKRHPVRPHIDKRVFFAISRHAEQGRLISRDDEIIGRQHGCERFVPEDVVLIEIAAHHHWRAARTEMIHYLIQLFETEPLTPKDPRMEMGVDHPQYAPGSFDFSLQKSFMAENLAEGIEAGKGRKFLADDGKFGKDHQPAAEIRKILQPVFF